MSQKGDAMKKIVGERVEATFDETTGSVVLYSNEGTLWRDWSKALEVNREYIRSIRIAEGRMYLPENASGIGDGNFLFAMFGGLTNVESIDLKGTDTSRVTDMGYMFNSCKNLTHLDLSSFDTSRVTDMNGMFYDCGSLTDLDLSSFDTSSVTDMNGMFCKCQRLVGLDLKGFNTSNVTDMSFMFDGCSNLVNLNLSDSDTSSVINMR